MFKVLLVDDETINYQLFEKLVPWEEKGFVIAGTAGDGIEALEQYEKLSPDVIFMDIQLPRMDGLECTRCIRQVDERTKIVIVSAYDEFSYAQKAIRYGVTDYLLKPLSRLVLLQLVDRLQKELKEEKEPPAEKAPLCPSLELTRLLEGGWEGGSPPEGPMVGVALADASGLPSSRETIREVLESVLAMPYPPVGIIEGKALIGGRDSLAAASFLSACRGRGLQGEVYPFDRDWGWAGDWLALFRTEESYGFYGGGEGVYVLCAEHFSRSVPPLDRGGEKIAEAIARADGGLLWETIASWLGEAARQKADPRLLKEELFDLLVRIKFELTRFDRQASFQVLRLLRPEVIYPYRTLEGMKGWMQERIYESFREIQEAFFGPGRRLVLRTNAYVETAYRDSSFSVQDAADYNGISKNYFTGLYKEQAGIGFWDYVTKRRMEKAKELLLTTEELVGTIAGMVGYESEFHFSRKFKELVGESPNQYRKNRKK